MSSTQDTTPAPSTLGSEATPSTTDKPTDFVVTAGGTEGKSDVDAKAAEEGIKSVEQGAGQVPGSEQPKDSETAHVGEKREREGETGGDSAVSPAPKGDAQAGMQELKEAEGEAGKEAKKPKVGEGEDAGTVPVEEAKETSQTDAPATTPAKGGAKRGRGRGKNSAKVTPSQGTRRSTRNKAGAEEAGSGTGESEPKTAEGDVLPQSMEEQRQTGMETATAPATNEGATAGQV